MANRTVKDAQTIKGTNPQYLVEKIVRTRIYDSKYWKEECFALTAELVVDKAMDLRYVGGTFAGNIKPTPFLCLVLKMLQIQPEKDIVIEFIKNEEYKYVRALGAFYLRLVGTSVECYKYLEPLLNDYRKIRTQKRDGKFELSHMDEFIDNLLRLERYCDVILPRLQKREVLEEANDIAPRVSILEDDLDEMASDSEDDEEEEGEMKEAATGEPSSDRKRTRERSRSRERRRRHRDMSIYGDFSADFGSIPVVDVNRFNWDDVWPKMSTAVRSADFIAVDCELSGLGDRKKLGSSDMDERYSNLSVVAKTRSVLALGISCFKKSAVDVTNYCVQTYNILTLCDEDYIVEPGSVKFLLQHGFNFQEQYSRGVLYRRGDEDDKQQQQRQQHPPTCQEGPDSVRDRCGLRDLFSLLVTCSCDIVVHNGLVDLVFLYQNMYAQLPSSLQSFIADLAEMFRIYDTKYLAEFVSRSPASYLEYLFRREQMQNLDKSARGLPHLRIAFPEYKPEDPVQYEHCAAAPVDASAAAAVSVCDTYSHHGHCPDDKKCSKSHDIDQILFKKEGKRWSKMAVAVNGSSTSSPPPIKRNKKGPPETPKRFGNSHRAGFDAFMTGFSMAAFLARKAKDDGVSEHANKVYLVCKDHPLLIKKSAFANVSTSHYVKFERLKKGKLTNVQ